MKIKRITLGGLLILGMIVLASGCYGGSKTETIIISDQDEPYNEAPSESRTFEVERIYRLPDEFTGNSLLLGWKASDEVVAVSYNSRNIRFGHLEQLTYPYKESEILLSLEAESWTNSLSPDGKYRFQVTVSSSHTILEIVSLLDGTLTEVMKISNPEHQFLQAVSWSDNGRYLAYVVLDASSSEISNMSVFDRTTQSSTTYTVNGLDEGDFLLGLSISDDGRSVLFKTYPSKENGKTLIKLGIVQDDEITIQYNHQLGRDYLGWLHNNQFAFLGTDGSLYAYDLRTRELSLLLDKVGNFAISRDKKTIAYAPYDEDIVYAGIIQGNNILHKEALYRGISPSLLEWSPNDQSLLIQGQKRFSSPNTGVMDDSIDGQSYIIKLK